MRFHVTIRKRKISGSDIIKLTQLEINRTAIKEKIVEAALSVLPIAVIVLLLCLMVTPMRPDLLLCFLIGAVMLVVGMGLFSLGAEQSAHRQQDRHGADPNKEYAADTRRQFSARLRHHCRGA